MLPGPTYVYECQSCKGLFERRSISSGNTSRAKFRSDGQMSAPMLPTTPVMVACPHCKSSIFWPKAKEVDSYETYDLTGIFDVGEMLPESLVLRLEKKAKKQKYLDVARYEQASPQQIFEFIQASRFDSSYELPLRLLCWQRSNDARLELGRVGLEFDERENLQKLLLLVDQSSDSHRLLRAEIFRQLTQFDEARFMLDYDFDEEMAARAEQLMLAIERKDSLPFQFVARDDEYDYETAWRARRYEPEDPSKFNFAELTPPVFKISNRDWWVKVLGMLCHNWALIERNDDGTATAYFFQDCPHGIRPAIIDSVEFPGVREARVGLKRNGFEILKNYPGPWMGCEPKGFIYDDRNEINMIYANGKYWN